MHSKSNTNYVHNLKQHCNGKKTSRCDAVSDFPISNTAAVRYNIIKQAQIRTYNKKYIESCYNGIYKGKDNKRKKYVVTNTNLAMKFYRTGIEKEYHNRQDS